MSPLPRRTRLKGLRVSRVDLVPAGDNPEAHITLAKSLTTADSTNPGGPTVPTELPTHLAPLADLDADAVDGIGAYVKALEDSAAEAAAQVAALAAEVETLKAADGADEGGDDDVVKALPAEARERLEKAEAAAAAADERIAKMERERRVEKAQADAAATMKSLGDPAQVGSLLVAVQDAVDEDTYKALEQTLRAAAERIGKGALFAEVGGTGEPTDAEARLEAAAKALRDADPSLTKAQSVAKALDADPSLYAQAQAERTA